MQRASNHDLFVFMATTGDSSSTGQAFQILRTRGYSNAQMTAIIAMFARVVRAGGDDFPGIPGPAGIVTGQPGDIVEPTRPVTPSQITYPLTPSPTPFEPIPIPVPIVENVMPEDGEDLRYLDDWIADEDGQLIRNPAPRDGNGNGDGEGIAAAGLPVAAGGAAALTLLRRVMGSVTTISRAHWDALPGWARTVLAAVGFGVGIDLAMDIPGVPGDSIVRDIFGGNGGGPHISPHMTDGHLGAHIVGSWQANGVTFYRLSDGKLAVQNKKGRWKVWRPKKPIVLMPGGAMNLKTLLRADKMLNTQAKQIAKVLNRRAPRAKRSSGSDKSTLIASDGKIIQV